MKNYFNFISLCLPDECELKPGAFVAISMHGGRTVEGQVIAFNDEIIALETYTGGKPLNEMEDVRDFAEGNSGHVIHYTLLPMEEVTSFTKYKLLNMEKNKNGEKDA